MDKKYLDFSVTSTGKAVNSKDGIYEVMASTEATDRAGDRVLADGIDTSRYALNPVVLWSHQYDQPPIAKTITFDKIPGVGLKARFQFPPTGDYERADVIHKLWDKGFINAASIGFTPIEWEPIKGGGYLYKKIELLEFSLTPIGMNQEALRLALKSAPGTRSKTEEELLLDLVDVWVDWLYLELGFNRSRPRLRNLSRSQAAPGWKREAREWKW